MVAWIYQNQIFVLLAVILAGFIATGWYFSILSQKVKILSGDGANPEDWQKNIIGRLTSLETQLKNLNPRINLLEEISKISVQKVGFLRFNPFQDTGGDQSFIAALLDKNNNGIIISSLYAREGVRVYGKEIKDGKAKHALSAEEKKVLEETIRKS